jgi:hypothetical protein
MAAPDVLHNCRFLSESLKISKKIFQIVNQSKFGFTFSREYQWINGAYSGDAPPNRQ